jgi:hypothetical protein
MVVTQKILLLAVALFGIPGVSNGYDGLYYPYSFPYRSYAYPYAPDSALELSRIRRELRSQRIRQSEQRRQRQEELNLLRQQAFDNHRVGARQACYYRSTGGFELCADLFNEGTAEFAECEAMVIRRNPSCHELPLSATGDDEHD